MYTHMCSLVKVRYDRGTLHGSACCWSRAVAGPKAVARAGQRTHGIMEQPHHPTVPTFDLPLIVSSCHLELVCSALTVILSILFQGVSTF